MCATPQNESRPHSSFLDIFGRNKTQNQIIMSIKSIEKEAPACPEDQVKSELGKADAPTKVSSAEAFEKAISGAPGIQPLAVHAGSGIHEIPVEILKYHPLSNKIYGEDVDPSLLESIQHLGRIINPVLITHDHVIISGNSRVRVARTLGYKTVPAIYFDSKDEVDIKEAVIEANAQREKTNLQKIREYNARKEIESDLGKRRMATKKGQGVKQIAEAEKGTAREKAAKELGLSWNTLEKGAKVLEEYERLAKDDKTKKKAETLLKTLTEKNISAAYDLAFPEKKEKKATANAKTKAADAPAEQTEAPAETVEDKSIKSHDQALKELDRIIEFVDGQENKPEHKGMQKEWREGLTMLIESLAEIGIDVQRS